MLRGNRTGCIQQLDSQKTTQSQMADVRSIMHCRVCLCETRGHRECQSSKYSCSGWSNEQSPQWTEEFHDTGNVGSASTGYVYQWSLQCESSDLSNGTTNYRNDDSNRTYQRNTKHDQNDDDHNEKFEWVYHSVRGNCTSKDYDKSCSSWC